MFHLVFVGLCKLWDYKREEPTCCQLDQTALLAFSHLFDDYENCSSSYFDLLLLLFLRVFLVLLGRALGVCPDAIRSRVRITHALQCLEVFDGA